MKYKTILLSITFASLLTNHAMADDTTYGIGAGIDNGIKIYFPINSGEYLIEPTIVILSDERESSDGSTINSDKFDTLELGLGFFRNNEAYKDTYMYYGARVGYTERTSENSFVNSTGKFKEDGYFIAPTIGFEYNLSSNFSLGLDFALFYTSTDGKNTNEFSGNIETDESERTSYRTLTEIIARYRF